MELRKRWLFRFGIGPKLCPKKKAKKSPGTIFYLLQTYAMVQMQLWRCETGLSSPVKVFLLTVPGRCFFFYRVC